MKTCDCNPPACPKCGNDDCEMVATNSWSRKTGDKKQFLCLKPDCYYQSPEFDTEDELLEFLETEEEKELRDRVKNGIKRSFLS